VEITEVGKHVYRLGTRWVNFYVVRQDDEFTLVDARYPRYFNQLTAGLAELGTSPDAISTVLVTHHHVDHDAH
jgi:glyoxylase-like metal-dependent hydrolase (beta-lactamase superfamily II)